MFTGCGLILLIITYLCLPSYLFYPVWALLISVGMLCCPSISDLPLICIQWLTASSTTLPFCPSYSLLQIKHPQCWLERMSMVILPEECQSSCTALRLPSAWLQPTCPALSWTISLNTPSLELSYSIHCVLSVHLCTLLTLSEMLYYLRALNTNNSHISM